MNAAAMSEARSPTPEQAAAIEAGGHDVLVEAGAGTGKTGVMVDRYCRLVCDQEVSPDAVLAFTFTDKAATELRQRIRAELELRAEAGSERARELLGAIGGAWVTTIHGFCNRLLAGHPVAAGIDPRFRVLDAPEAERAARRGLRRGAGGVPRRRRGGARARPSPRSRSTACGRSSAASTPSCAAAASPSRACRSRPAPDPEARRPRTPPRSRRRRWRS